jgi:hypothetical protein
MGFPIRDDNEEDSKEDQPGDGKDTGSRSTIPRDTFPFYAIIRKNAWDCLSKDQQIHTLQSRWPHDQFEKFTRSKIAIYDSLTYSSAVRMSTRGIFRSCHRILVCVKRV